MYFYLVVAYYLTTRYAQYTIPLSIFIVIRVGFTAFVAAIRPTFAYLVSIVVFNIILASITPTIILFANHICIPCVLK